MEPGPALRGRFGPGLDQGRQCGGVQIIITDRDKVMPVEAGIHLIEAINTLYEMLETITNTDLPEPEKLKVLVGHSPLQVAVGGLIGLLTGFFIH